MNNLSLDIEEVNENSNMENIPLTIDDELEKKINTVYYLVKNNIKNMIIKPDKLPIIISKILIVINDISNLDSEDIKIIITEVVLKLIMNDNTISSQDIELMKKTLDLIINLVISSLGGEFKLSSHKYTHPKSPEHIIDLLIDRIIEITDLKDSSNLPVNIMSIVGLMISIIEKYPNLLGIEKKEIIIEALQKLIRDVLPKYIDIDDNNNELLELSLIIAPNVIDMLVSIIKDKFDFNHDNFMKKLRKFFTCCRC